nr:acyl-coa synthetase family member 3, mitochondrial [Quercus suber]
MFSQRQPLLHLLRSCRSSFSPSCTRLTISSTRWRATFSTTSLRAGMASIQRSAFFEAIQSHDPKAEAVVHSLSGRSFQYGSLLRDVAQAKGRLLQMTGKDEQSIQGERIAFLIENSYDYVVTLLACLASNAIAVPLAPSFPASELRYNINHSEALVLLSSPKFAQLAAEVFKEGIETNVINHSVEKITQGAKEDDPVRLSGDVSDAEGGMMLYTSGTTARPKGVLLPTNVLVAQAKSLVEAWKYTSQDRLLHVLPLHHIHGTVNALLTPLLAGSTIEFMFPFNVDAVWKRFAAPFMAAPPSNVHEKTTITFFTVVPTIWARMLQSEPKLPNDIKTASQQAIKRENLRLNISGSAALPTPTKNAWSKVSSGNVLLERYGMTEVGMALSCGLADQDRIDGSVGWPLPSVEARLVDPDTNQLIQSGADTTADGKEVTGEIQLRGPTIFKSYWRNPAATKKEFTPDGWFKTGDIAVRQPVPGAGEGASGSWATGPAFFIRGRASADIIKSGGEKVSALEIERELLALPEIHECAVVGLPSETWGQKVAAVVVLSEHGRMAGKGGKAWGAMDMRRALKGKLVAYKIPQDLQVVEEIARNAMGKVNKKELVAKVFGDQDRIRSRSVEVREERERGKKEESR